VKRIPNIGDSEYGRICRMLGIETTWQQDHAAVRLENCGQRFCVDFGTENAVEKWEAQKKQNA